MFNKNFMWGVGTSSFQIEGGYNKDEKEKSIWDDFCSIKGNVYEGHNGNTACDSYNRYKDDINLLKKFGIKYYRFSISWPRVIHNGIGKINKKGIEYYLDLINELKSNGIEPVVTLFHWDLPSVLQKMGGFLNLESPKWFEYYTDVVTKAFGILVKYYVTINEPQCIVNLGYNTLEHAPGIKLSDKDLLQVIHNLLLCHGRSVKTIRKNCKDAKVSFAPCSRAMVPINSKDENLKNEVYEKFFSIYDNFSESVSIYSDPIYLGDYPKEYYIRFKDILPKIGEDDFKIISQPLDFCAQNIYSGDYYDFEEGTLIKLPKKVGRFGSDLDWLDVVPKSLYYGPLFLYQRYNKPILISENGISEPDIICLDGKVHDQYRIDFINRYLVEFSKVSNIIPTIGYFLWSFIDNFEWAHGYSKRFGLVYVDFVTLERIAKDSFYYYKKIIRSNGNKLRGN